jgi:HEAT repeat protein
LCAFAFTASAWALDNAAVERWVTANDFRSLKNQGEEVMPIMAALYTQTNDIQKRTRIASLFYQLGWKSEAAKNALLQDMHTDDRALRLQVQWAIGRVSNDDRIVDILLETMHADENPLFRDKAACALAYDQIHLTSKQRFKLLEGLVRGLNDPKPDVRRIAILALSIQTGQTKGYNPDAWEGQRNAAILEWETWLREYKSNL